jgi:hypothetical protein
LVGDIFSQSAFLDTHQVLKELRNKGQLKCFKWWCPTCKDQGNANDEDLISHAFSISFTTFRRIIGANEVDWRWLNPDSEWAVRSGNPKNAAEKLLNSKSRPKWKVILALAVYESEV